MKNFIMLLMLLGLMNIFVCFVILNEVKDLPPSCYLREMLHCVLHDNMMRRLYQVES